GQWSCGRIVWAKGLWHNDMPGPMEPFPVSPMLIAALVSGGLIIPVGIGLLNQAVERARLDRARALAELQARWKHTSAVTDELPGQFMTVELKTLLLRLQAALLERLVRLDSKQPAHAEQLQTIRQQLDKGE